MISEAALTGKPIYVAQMPAIKKNNRFKDFFELFERLNIIKNLGTSVEDWNYQKLDPFELQTSRDENSQLQSIADSMVATNGCVISMFEPQLGIQNLQS